MIKGACLTAGINLVVSSGLALWYCKASCDYFYKHCKRYKGSDDNTDQYIDNIKYMDGAWMFLMSPIATGVMALYGAYSTAPLSDQLMKCSATFLSACVSQLMSVFIFDSTFPLIRLGDKLRESIFGQYEGDGCMGKGKMRYFAAEYSGRLPCILFISTIPAAIGYAAGDYIASRF